MVAPFLIAGSPFNGSRIDHREADSIAMAWLNMLSAEQIDRFLCQKKDVWLLCMKREPRNTYEINLVRAIDG